jgi:hypothetical protein
LLPCLMEVTKDFRNVRHISRLVLLGALIQFQPSKKTTKSNDNSS